MKRKGKTIAILAGLGVVVLGILLGTYWKAIYYYTLYPEERLWGRWEVVKDDGDGMVVTNIVEFRDNAVALLRYKVIASGDLIRTAEAGASYQLTRDSIVFSDHVGAGGPPDDMFEGINRDTLFGMVIGSFMERPGTSVTVTYRVGTNDLLFIENAAFGDRPLTLHRLPGEGKTDWWVVDTDE